MIRHEDAIKLLIANWSDGGYFTKVNWIDDALHCRFNKLNKVRGYKSCKFSKDTVEDIIGFIKEFYQIYMCSFYGTAPGQMKQFIELSEDDLRQVRKFGILINLINYSYDGKEFDTEAYGKDMNLEKVYDSLCTWNVEVA